MTARNHVIRFGACKTYYNGMEWTAYLDNGNQSRSIIGRDPLETESVEALLDNIRTTLWELCENDLH